MSKPPAQCPAGHVDTAYPYNCATRSLCPQCGDLVQFTPVLPEPSRIVTMPFRERIAKPARFNPKLVRAPHND